LNATVVAKKRQAMVIDEKIISKFFFLKFLISVGHVSFLSRPQTPNLEIWVFLYFLFLPKTDRSLSQSPGGTFQNISVSKTSPRLPLFPSCSRSMRCFTQCPRCNHLQAFHLSGLRGQDPMHSILNPRLHPRRNESKVPLVPGIKCLPPMYNVNYRD